MSPSRVQTPRQARSAQTLSKVLDACDALLARQPFEQISMQDIAHEAGVSVGNLYNRFADRDALVDHILERRQQEFQQFVEQALQAQDEDLPLRARVDVLADTLHAGLANLRPVFATLVSRQLAGKDLTDDHRASSDAILNTAAAWLCRRNDEIRGDKIERARFAIASLTFGLQFDVLLGTALRLFGDDYLIHAKHQAYSYLTAEES